MNPHTHRIRLAAVLLACLSMVACKDGALQNAALAIKGVADSNKTLAATVIAENHAGNISGYDAEIILKASDKMADAVIVAAKLTKNYTTFDPNARPALITVVAPVVVAVKEAIDTGIVGIQNPALKSKINTILLSIQAALGVAQTALGGQ